MPPKHHRAERHPSSSPSLDSGGEKGQGRSHTLGYVIESQNTSRTSLCAPSRRRNCSASMDSKCCKCREQIHDETPFSRAFECHWEWTSSFSRCRGRKYYIYGTQRH